MQILDFLRSFDPVPDVILFPELSIPYCLLPQIHAFCCENQSTILAGTHTFQNTKEARRIYHRTLNVKQKHIDGLKSGGSYAPGVMPIISRRRTRLVPKSARSPFEVDDVSPLLSAAPTLYPFTLDQGASVLPLICAEALTDYTAKEDYQLICVVSYSDALDYFRDFADRETKRKRAVIYCNDGQFGGSQVSAVRDRRMASWWFDTPLAGALPKGEGILIYDINLNSLAVEIGVSNPDSTLEMICIASVTYADDPETGSEISDVLPSIRGLVSEGARVELDTIAKSNRCQELQSLRLEQLRHLSAKGTASPRWWDSIGRDCVLRGIPSLSQLQGFLAKSCQSQLLAHMTNTAQLTGDLPALLVGFITECNSKIKEAGVTPDSEASSNSYSLKDIIDREDEVTSLLDFLGDKGRLVCQLSGIPEIGKTAVVDKALAQSGLGTIHRIPVRDTSSSEYIAYSIMRRTWPSLKPPYADLRKLLDSREFRSAMRSIDVIVLENAANLIRYDTWRDHTMHNTLVMLLEIACEERTKIIFETQRELQIDYPQAASFVRKRVGDLPTEYGVRLLDRELRRVQGIDAAAIPQRDKERIVSFFGGHPVALSLVANAVYETGVQQVMNDIKARKGFYTQYIGRLLNEFSLSQDERIVLKLINGCNMPVPREAILGACAFPAGPVVTRLIHQCVVNVNSHGHISTAGLLKPFFDFSELPEELRIKLHENAAREFGVLARRNREYLHYAVEADYHAAIIGVRVTHAEGLVDSRLEAADTLYNEQRYREAKGILDPLLGMRQSRSVLRLSALVDAQCGSFDSALSKAKATYATGSPDPWLMAELTRIALSLQRDDVAERLIYTAKASGIDDVSICIIEGRLALRRKNIRAAEEAFARACKMSTHNAWPYFYLGRTLLDDGRVDDAINILFTGEQFIYDKRIRHRTVLIRIRVLLAKAYLYINDLDAAEQVILQLFAENPDDPEIVRIYAAFTLKKEGIADAQKAFEKLAEAKVRNRHDECQKNLFLGLFYLGISERNKAIKCFSEAHRADNNNVFVLITWAKALLEMGEAVLEEGGEAEAAHGYAFDCARIVNRILNFSPGNAAGIRLQEQLYSKFGIDSGDLTI